MAAVSVELTQTEIASHINSKAAFSLTTSSHNR